MNSHVAVTRKTSKPKQSGAATIMVILMIGVGLVAVSVGTMHTMRSTQERQQVAHAQVNAQSGAWAAVEVARQYLGTLKADQLKVLGTNPWSIIGTAGLTQSVKIASVVQPDPSDPTFRVNAQVSATATAGGSTSTIDVVYEVTPGAAPTPFELKGVLDFYNDLEMKGDITLDSNDTGLSFNVDGDFTAASVSIKGTGLKKMAVTGDVTVGSSIAVEELWGRNVTINGGASAKKVYAFGDPDKSGEDCCGNVTMTGGTGVEKIFANGTVQSGGGGVSEINARRNVQITRGGTTHDRITAGGTVSNATEWGGSHGGTINEFVKAISGVNLGGIDMTGTSVQGIFSQTYVTTANNAKVKAITALGNVTAKAEDKIDIIKSGGNVAVPNVDTKSIEATGNVTCVAGGYKSYPSIRAKTISNCTPTTASSFVTTTVAAPTVGITMPDKVPPVTLERPKVDAWQLRSAANYALEVKDTGLMVTVKSVNGVPDDTYYLRRAKGSGTNREFLCRELDSGECKAPIYNFCYGQSANDSCITATPGNKAAVDPKTGEKIRASFLIKGVTLVPGVVWFNGDLTIKNGTYYNTFISTGNFKTEGATISYALNYAAAYKASSADTVRKNAVCKMQYSGYADAVTAFANQYPTNYCLDGVYVPNAVGNIGILAGGYNTADDTVAGKTSYSGGYIYLGASNHIYGTIVSGDLLETGGATYVYGYVSAAGLKIVEDAENVMGGSTTINLKDLPDGYDPSVIPDMSGGGAGVTAESKVLWTRYL